MREAVQGRSELKIARHRVANKVITKERTSAFFSSIFRLISRLQVLANGK